MRGAAHAVLAAASAALALTRTASADDGDGAYGRLDGDLLFVGSAGIGVEAGGVVFETHVGLLYLSTCGPYLRYTEGFGQEELRYGRSVGGGFELRPLFLARYALDLERGPAHLDLFADSLTLIAGTYWAAPRARPLHEEPGLELGVGIEVPFTASASGPYFGVQGLARFPGTHLVGAAEESILRRGSMLVFTLSWHQIFGGGLVDLRDSRGPR